MDFSEAKLEVVWIVTLMTLCLVHLQQCVTAELNTGLNEVYGAIEAGSHEDSVISETAVMRNRRQSSDGDNDLISVHDLVVSEGFRSAITVANVNFSLAHRDFDLPDSSVVFRVVKPPSYGDIFVNIDRNQITRKEFTAVDLLSNRVMYIHDDSEATSDSIAMQIEFKNAPEDMPEKFHQKYGFTLVVRILPNNDRPRLNLPPNNTMLIIANTQIKITSKILNITDADDSSTNLKYLVTYPRNVADSFFQLLGSSGYSNRSTSFLHSDVIDGRLYFIHTGEPVQFNITLQVSDGKDLSEPKILNMLAAPLKIYLIANNVLIIPHGSVRLITSDHLQYATNAVHQEIDLRYDITESTLDGKVQRMQYAGTEWTDTSSFTQKHINRNRLRYTHTGLKSSSQDYFRFKISALNIESQEYEFQIRMIVTEVRLVNNVGLHLIGSRDGLITTDKLKATSSVPYHTPSDIVYHILASPRNGYIVRLDDKGFTKFLKNSLTFGSNFTQEEINKGKIGFRLQKALLSSIRDDSEFRLFIPGAQSDVSIFEFSYEATSEDQLQFINNGLIDVQEGESKVITQDNLFTKKMNVENFRYTLFDFPQHGSLQLIDTNYGWIKEDNATNFTNDDIVNQGLFYLHDNSESDEDSFGFTVTSMLSQTDLEIPVQEITELSGVFDIKIVLRNDNPPKRYVDKVFNVVASRGRVITPEDLWFIDPDVDFNSSKLEYEWTSISNGEIVSVDDRSNPVFRFTQKGIEDGKLYFQHIGSRFGRAVLWVTDGYFFATGVLEIEASNPFINIVNATSLNVSQGATVTLSPEAFNIDTNLDADDKNIRFLIVGLPMHGVILKNNKEKHAFNMADLKNRIISYKHTGSEGEEFSDDFQFFVKIDNFNTQGVMKIKILHDSRNRALKIIRNKVAAVDELDLLTLTPDYLNISCIAVGNTNVEYTITSQPRHGTLWLSGEKELHEPDTFVQEDIDQGRINYEHQIEGRMEDTFQFDVRCDDAELLGLEFVFDIIPSVIPLEVENITVKEGSSSVITTNSLKLGNKYFENSNLEFLIVVPPKNGWIEIAKSVVKQQALQFNYQNLASDEINFVHDGSETVEDEFTVMAKFGKKNRKSGLKTIWVTIIPENDEAPKLIVNRKLEAWPGSVTTITSQHLHAVDNDTAPDDIIYRVGQISNGEVMLVEKPLTNRVMRFSQANVDRNEIIFRLKGTESGSFDFNVTDGVNMTEMMTFHVEVKPIVMLLESFNPMDAFPGLLQPITSSHLKAVTNDTAYTMPIIYTVETEPSKGRLVTIGINGPEKVTSFTQDEINANAIFYEQNGKMASWQDEDSFMFEVHTAYAPGIVYQTFNIFISYGNINDNNREQLMTLGFVVVDEGGSVQVTRWELDVSKLETRLADDKITNARVNVVILDVPKHGLLTVGRNNLTTGDRFTQADVDNGHVVYLHDDSDTERDAFSFVIEFDNKVESELKLGSSGNSSKLSRQLNVFNIFIRPINDQPFVLHTVTPKLELLQGSTCNITQKSLFATDLDNKPEEIEYEVVTPPNNGYLVHLGNTGQPVLRFTQMDIDQRTIQFIHDGSPNSGAFYFKVWDGKHKPLYKVFNVHVTKLSLELTQINTIDLLQGQFSAVLSRQNFQIKTNGKRDRVMYNVTHAPIHGNLYSNGAITTRFTQKEVDTRKVTYVQTDFFHSSDSFEFVVYDIQNSLWGNQVNISVRPNVRKRGEPSRIYFGDNFTITVNDLDASNLSIITGSDPIYYVTTEPSFGTLVKTSNHSRSARSVKEKSGSNRKVRKSKYVEAPVSYLKNSTFTFTHDDVINERVQYVYNQSTNETMLATLNDKFTYMLTARNAQPTEGVFEIELRLPPMPGNDIPSAAISGPSYSSRRAEPMSDANNLLIILAVITGLVLILVIVIVLIVCKLRLWKRGKRKEDPGFIQQRLKQSLAREDDVRKKPTQNNAPPPEGANPGLPKQIFDEPLLPYTLPIGVARRPSLKQDRAIKSRSLVVSDV